MSKVLRYGELFCGPGGLALGATKAGIKRNGTGLRIEHAWGNAFRAYDWSKALPIPELTINQVKQLLTLDEVRIA